MAFKDIGKALAILRRKQGISQAELSKSCSIGRAQLYRYESGKELMRLATLEKILRRLAVTPTDFFRFLESLDPASAPQLLQAPIRFDGPRLAEVFRKLHSAIDELRQVIESANDPAGRLGIPAGGDPLDSRQASDSAGS
jgi:transcriptional regulator with XRE-family HTH domain